MKNNMIVNELIKGNRPRITKVTLRDIKRNMSRRLGFELDESTWEQIGKDCRVK